MGGSTIAVGEDQRKRFILKKWISVSTKIISRTTVFILDNNKKCFFRSKSAY